MSPSPTLPADATGAATELPRPAAAGATLVPYRDIEDFGQALLMARGMRPADAACVARTLVWADLHGVPSHGSALFPVYLKWIAAGDMDPTAAPSLSAREGSRFTLDGNHCVGAVAMTQAAHSAIEIARQTGLCVATIRDTTHTGAIGRYGSMIAERGCAALALVAGPPLMAYHGARVPSASTSPVMFALPGPDNEPVVFDMATSLVSFRRLQQARASGEALPDGAAIDLDGVVTSDASRARIPLPIAGPKGSGLSIMIEMLVSLVAGNPLVTDHLRPDGARRHSQNALLLVLDVAAFRPLQDFRDDMAGLIETIKGLPMAAGFTEIRMPGERGQHLAAQRATSGIPIPAAVHAEMRLAATELGVPLPASLA